MFHESNESAPTPSPFPFANKVAAPLCVELNQNSILTLVKNIIAHLWLNQ
jgi:hypothetical protein